VIMALEKDGHPHEWVIAPLNSVEMDLALTPVQLSIIYVNWNSLDYLEKSVASVVCYTSSTAVEIIVVDNASTQDGLQAGLEKIAAMGPNVRVFSLRENLGFASANNLGASHARGETLLLLNPDTELTGPAIDTMMAHLARLPDAGVLGCRLLNSDGSVQTTSIQLLPTILNQVLDSEALRLRWPGCPLWSIEPLFWQLSAPVEVETISGACMLVSKRVFQSVGGFSEEYFMYAEDLDLCYKIAKSGFRNYYCGDATLIHYGGRSSGRQSVNQWATRMKFRATVMLLRKMRGRMYAFGYRLAMFSMAVARLALIACALCVSWKNKARASLWWSWSKWVTVLNATFVSTTITTKSKA